MSEVIKAPGTLPDGANGWELVGGEWVAVWPGGVEPEPVPYVVAVDAVMDQ